MDVSSNTDPSDDKKHPSKKKSILSSSVDDALCVLDNTEFVDRSRRKTIDIGLMGTCITFLVAILAIDQKALDGNLHNAVLCFGVALPLLGWGYLHADLQPKRVAGYLVLQSILIGTQIVESAGGLAASLGFFFVLQHLSVGAGIAGLFAGLFAIVAMPIFSFIGLFVFAFINREELARRFQEQQKKVVEAHGK